MVKTVLGEFTKKLNYNSTTEERKRLRKLARKITKIPIKITIPTEYW